MSGSWLTIGAYAFVYGSGAACIIFCLTKIAGLVATRRPRNMVLETDRQLDYFLHEAERLMAERRRVQRQRDAMLLRNAPNWPPRRDAPPKFPLLEG